MPATVIEIGTKFGDSALWFADMLSAQGSPNARVISVDITPATTFSDPRITFLEGDAKSLGAVLSDTLLASCSRPFLVIEDSSHFYAEAMAVLTFFYSRLQSGDYIVVEHGSLSQMSDEHYARYRDGPNHAVSEFLALHGDDYGIDEGLCDHYGYNLTYNPNGYLFRR